MNKTEQLEKLERQIAAIEFVIQYGLTDDKEVLLEIKNKLALEKWHIEKFGCRNGEYWAEEHTKLTRWYNEALQDKGHWRKLALELKDKLEDLDRVRDSG